MGELRCCSNLPLSPFMLRKKKVVDAVRERRFQASSFSNSKLPPKLLDLIETNRDCRNLISKLWVSSTKKRGEGISELGYFWQSGADLWVRRFPAKDSTLIYTRHLGSSLCVWVPEHERPVEEYLMLPSLYLARSSG
ncbi:unnamed protein product [Linum trigynum]|uniref:Uncharacterized protein n=1 Tax=Linum trigynum TaxID=586398 RepID=A0AAV2F343_9ROSI